MRTAHVDSASKEKKDKDVMKESLMLPCTSAGKTTSASIAERSNVWAENKLLEKKNVLDKKLYKNIVKMNTDKLEIVHELSKLQKSASTGSLDRMAKSKDEKHSQRTDTGSTSMVKSVSKSSLHSASSLDKKNSDAALTTSPGKKTRSETLLKHTESKAKISITLGGDSSSDEQSDEERSIQNHKHEHKHTFSLTSCPFGRECGANRSELRKFENATKRFTRQLSPKTRNGK